MSQVKCPQCGGREFKPEGGKRFRCASCGTELVYGTRRIAFLLVCALVGALIGLLSRPLFELVGLDGGYSARTLFTGALTGLAAVVLWRHFRRPRRA